jgi:hypothetical protein
MRFYGLHFPGWDQIPLMRTGFAAVGLLSIFPKISDPKEK